VPYHPGVGGPEVAIERIHLGIGTGVDGLAPVAEMQRGRTRNGHLRSHARGLPDEPEVVDHRVAGIRGELADRAQQNRLGLRPLELHLPLTLVGFHAAETLEKVDLPERTPELSVRRRLQADGFLLRDDLADFFVFDLAERIVADLSGRPLRAGFLQSRRAEKAADMVGAERRPRSRYDGLSPIPEGCRAARAAAPPSLLLKSLLACARNR
jgi:hypothetical protein